MPRPDPADPDVSWVVVVLIALAVIALLAIGFLGAMGVRRSQLRRTLGTFDASLRPADGSWVRGICRYADHHLEFLRLASVSPIPAWRFARAGMELKGRRDAEPGERSRLPAGSIVVSLGTDHGPIDLGMSYEAYTGLSAWLEAGPVAGVGTWRQIG